MRVVVTGGGTSVPAAIALSLADAGHDVYICDVNAEGLQQVCDAHPRIRGEIVDCTDHLAVDRFFGTVLKHFDAVDALVNGVGIAGPHAAIEDVSVDDWDLTMRGCVGASFYCARHVIPGMKRQKAGSIVNFSTSSTRTGLPMRTPYVVSKTAVEAFTKNLARELGPHNIRVNCILPGAINNERLRMAVARAAASKGISMEEEFMESLKYVSMRCMIEVQELVDAVEFLIGPKTPHVTGQLLAVDGYSEWE